MPTIRRQHSTITGSSPGAGMDYVMSRSAAWSQARFLSTDPVGMNRQRMTDVQQWNMFAYCKNSPLSFVDPDGRTVKPQDIAAFNKIKATLPAELKSKVTLYSDGTLKVANANTTDKNFKALKEMADSKEIVDVGTADSVTTAEGETTQFEFQTQAESDAEVAAFGVTVDPADPPTPNNFLGYTFAKDISPTGNIFVVLSDGTGKAATAPPVEHAMTAAHELYGHALLMLQGRPNKCKDNGPVDKMMNEIESRTRTNYETP